MSVPKPPRLFALIVLNLILLGLVLAIAPQQAPVTLYKLSLVTTAGLVGYWLDRALFPYARPDAFMCQPFSIGAPFVPSRAISPDLHLVFAACVIRRAIIVAAAMLAMGLGA